MHDINEAEIIGLSEAEIKDRQQKMKEQRDAVTQMGIDFG
jgi:hypothetical protein